MTVVAGREVKILPHDRRRDGGGGGRAWGVQKEIPQKQRPS